MPASKKKSLKYREGSLHQRKSGPSKGLWQGTFTYTDPDGKQIRKTGSSMDKETAKVKLAAIRREYMQQGDLISGSPTLTQWLDVWYARTVVPKNRPKTASTYKTIIEQYIKPAIGKRRLDTLTPAHVRRLHSYIMDEKGLSSTTAQKAHRVLGVALKYAEREGKVRKNVATLTDAPAKAARSGHELTLVDGMNIFGVVQGTRLASLTQARLLTGARQGELLGLELDRITDRIELSWQIQRIPYIHGCGGKCGMRAETCPERTFAFPRGHEHRHIQGGLWLTRPKSKAGWRVIPLFDPLAQIIEDRILASKTEANPHGLLWTSSPTTGAPIDPSPDNRAWHEILVKAGVPDVRVHDARRLTATLLLANRVPQTMITRILGHSTYAMSEAYMNVEDEAMILALSGSMKGLSANSTARDQTVIVPPAPQNG